MSAESRKELIQKRIANRTEILCLLRDIRMNRVRQELTAEENDAFITLLTTLELSNKLDKYECE